MAFWNRLQSVFFGGAIGAAAADGIRPVLEPVRQKAWEDNQVKVLEPATAASMAAHSILSRTDAHSEAARNGIAPSRTDALIALAQTFPGLADLDKLQNRKLVGDGAIKDALRREGYPESWIQPLVDLFQDLLSPADVAAAVQQGHIPNDGILPEPSAAVTPAQGAVIPPAPDGQPPSTVPLTQIDIPPIEEAGGSGIDLERLKVLANLAGLPPGADLLLNMWNRQLIDEETVDAGLREGHLKTKWSGAFKRLRWAVLSASEYANLHLRNWITVEQMYEGGALTGHTKDQMDLMFLNRGRPMAPVQAFTAWARDAPHPHGEGVPDRPGTFDKEDFANIIARSDVRPEYLEPLWAIRHAYPSLFQLSKLATAHALPEDRVRTILKYERYEQQDIDALVDYWYRGSTTAAADTRPKLAQSQAIAALKKQFLREKVDGTQALDGLASLGVPDAAARAIVNYWGLELSFTDKLLTPAQIKKAYGENLKTRDEAIAELLAQHYSLDDAQTFLQL